MDDHNDLFKGMVDDGDDDSTVDELECDLNQLCKAWPNLTSENLDADGLIDFDREVATNESRSMPVGEIVNENLPQPIEFVKDGSSDEDEVHDELISPPYGNKVDKEINTVHNRFGSRYLACESLKQNQSKKIGQNETIFY